MPVRAVSVFTTCASRSNSVHDFEMLMRIYWLFLNWRFIVRDPTISSPHYILPGHGEPSPPVRGGVSARGPTRTIYAQEAVGSVHSNFDGREQGGGDCSHLAYLQVPGDRLRRDVTGLLPGSEYFFRVAAINRMGRGPWSEISNKVRAGKRAVCLDSLPR